MSGCCHSPLRGRSLRSRSKFAVREFVEPPGPQGFSSPFPTILISVISIGGKGIRTPGPVSRTTVFKTAALNRSAIPPARVNCSRWSNICQFIWDNGFQDTRTMFLAMSIIRRKHLVRVYSH